MRRRLPSSRLLLLASPDLSSHAPEVLRAWHRSHSSCPADHSTFYVWNTSAHSYRPTTPCRRTVSRSGASISAGANGTAGLSFAPDSQVARVYVTHAPGGHNVWRAHPAPTPSRSRLRFDLPGPRARYIEQPSPIKRRHPRRPTASLHRWATAAARHPMPLAQIQSLLGKMRASMSRARRDPRVIASRDNRSFDRQPIAAYP